jgi:PEGA domain
MANMYVTINMLAPVNIISTNIIATPTSCVEPCEAVATVTWQNTGDIRGEFVPEIIVDGNSSITLPSEQLDRDQIVTHSFTIPSLMAGQHTIQASPNVGTSQQIIDVIVGGEAFFSSTIPGAEIWIDGIDTGFTTPGTVPSLAPGFHTYQLRLPGYYDEPSTVETFIVIQEQVTEVPEVTMVPALRALDISSVPTGADIYIDESLQIPKTNATIGDLTLGTHTYRLVLAGYQEVIGTFDIIDGPSIVISVTLVTMCESATIIPSKSSAHVGETINLTINTIPTTLSFNIEIRDQNDNLIGTCTTSISTGTCSISWNTTGLHSGEYNLRVVGQCTSSPVMITLLDICSWIASKGGSASIATFDIMTLVSAYLGHADIGFPVTIVHIMGGVSYYLGNVQSGNSLTGCSSTNNNSH